MALFVLGCMLPAFGEEIPAEYFEPENAHKGLPLDLMAWYIPGNVRAHREACPRFQNIRKHASDAEKAKWEHITLAEIEKRGAYEVAEYAEACAMALAAGADLVLMKAQDELVDQSFDAIKAYIVGFYRKR